jgi:hypothetical protein
MRPLYNKSGRDQEHFLARLHASSATDAFGSAPHAAVERKPESGKAATAPDGATQRAEAGWCLIYLGGFPRRKSAK